MHEKKHTIKIDNKTLFKISKSKQLSGYINDWKFSKEGTSILLRKKRTTQVYKYCNSNKIVGEFTKLVES